MYDIQQACYPFAIISELRNVLIKIPKNVLQEDPGSSAAPARGCASVGEVHRLHPLLFATGPPARDPGLRRADRRQAGPLPPRQEINPSPPHPSTVLPGLLSHPLSKQGPS